MFALPPEQVGYEISTMTTGKEPDPKARPIERKETTHQLQPDVAPQLMHL